MGEFLTAEAIFAKGDTRPSRVVEVPEWGGAVLIRAFSKSQFIAIQKASRVNPVDGEGGDIEEFQRQMILHGIEEPKFTEDQVRAMFDSQPGLVIDRLLVAIGDLNALSKEAQDAMKARFRGPRRGQPTV